MTSSISNNNIDTETAAFIKNLAMFDSADGNEIKACVDACDRQRVMDTEEVLAVLLSLIEARTMAASRLCLFRVLDALVSLDRSVCMTIVVDESLPKLTQLLDSTLRMTNDSEVLQSLWRLIQSLKRLTRFRKEYFSRLEQTFRDREPPLRPTKRRRSPSPPPAAARHLPRIHIRVHGGQNGGGGGDDVSTQQQQPEKKRRHAADAQMDLASQLEQLAHALFVADPGSLSLATLLDTDMLRMTPSAAVNLLYHDHCAAFPALQDGPDDPADVAKAKHMGPAHLQCKTCGERQRNSKCMAHHLDEHFARVKRDEAAARTSSSTGWASSASDWVTWDSSKPQVQQIKTEEEVKQDKQVEHQKHLNELCKIGRFRDPNAAYEETCAICHEIFTYNNHKEVDDDPECNYVRGIMQPLAALAVQEAGRSFDELKALSSRPSWIELQDRLTRFEPKELHSRFVHADCFVTKTDIVIQTTHF